MQVATHQAHLKLTEAPLLGCVASLRFNQIAAIFFAAFMRLLMSSIRSKQESLQSLIKESRSHVNQRRSLFRLLKSVLHNTLEQGQKTSPVCVDLKEYTVRQEALIQW